MTASVTLTQHVRATPDVVFRAWTTPEDIRTWYAPVEEWVVGIAEIDARVGGRYRVSFGPPPAGDAYLEQGVYTDVQPAARLAFDWTVGGDGMGEDAGDAVVTFAADGDGTLVTVVDNCSTEEQARDHEGGWTVILANLAAHLAPQDSI